MFIYWDCKILSGTATFHKRGVLDCNFQNPSEIPAHDRQLLRMCMKMLNVERYFVIYYDIFIIVFFSTHNSKRSL